MLMSIICPTGRSVGEALSAVRDPSAPSRCPACSRALLRRPADQLSAGLGAGSGPHGVTPLLPPPCGVSPRLAGHGGQRGCAQPTKRAGSPSQTPWKWLVRFSYCFWLCVRAASAEQGTWGRGRPRGDVGKSIPKKRESWRHGPSFAPPCAMHPREEEQQDTEGPGTVPPPHARCILRVKSQMKFFPSPSICEDSSQTTNQCSTVSYLLCSQLSKTT